MTTLFNQKTIQRLCKDTLITTTHKKYVKEWFKSSRTKCIKKRRRKL